MSISSLQPDRTEPRAWALRLPLPLLLLGIALLALVQQWLVVPNANIAWLLTVAERMLDGQRIYVDTIETNPPFSIWLYLPAAWLGRVLHVRAEWLVHAMVLGAGLWSVRATVTGLQRADLLHPERKRPFSLAVAAVLLLLPAACFGEREHIALIAFLRLTATACARASGYAPGHKDVVVSSLCAALVVIIKPHFALAIGAMACTCAWKARSWRLLLAPEHRFAGLLTLSYGGLTWILHPEFWTAAMPLNADLYLPVRLSPVEFLWHFANILLTFVAMLVITAYRERAAVRLPALALASGGLGFFAAVVLQGKGMAYHFYPALALSVLLPFAIDVAPRNGMPAARLLAIALAVVHWTFFNSAFDLRKAVEMLPQGLSKPKILALGYDFSIGPPVARAAGGTYVGRTTSQWMADNAAWLKNAEGPESFARLDAYVAQDRAWFVDDLVTQRPDVLFIQRSPDDWRDFAKDDPRFDHAFADFEFSGHVESTGMRNGVVLGYDMWRRKRP